MSGYDDLFVGNGIGRWFPLSRLELLKKWVHAVRRKNFVPTPSSRICSAHFTENFYVEATNNKYYKLKLLKSDAVLSYFSVFLEYLQIKSKKP